MVVFVKVWAIVLPEPPVAPVIPAPGLAVQVNVVPATLLVIATELAVPEQMLCGEAKALGIGSTVTIIGTAIPEQFVGAGPVGVTVYVTVPGVVPGLVNVCEIGVPEPAPEPVMPAEGLAVQLNTAPATVLLKATLLLLPEQIVCGLPVTLGIGFTVTVTAVLGPTQPSWVLCT